MYVASVVALFAAAVLLMLCLG